MIKKGLDLVQMQSTELTSEDSISHLSDKLPIQLKRVVTDVLNADPSATYVYTCINNNLEFHLFLLEHHLVEAYTMCHYFVADTNEKDASYTYTSIPFPCISFFTDMQRELKFTSHPLLP